jgi:phosphatidylglycerol:prolipoprotein diacylglycerol transferase
LFPILNIGGLAIQLPGLILLLGYWLSLNLAGRRAKSRGVSEDAIFNAGFIALSAGLVGARLGYVILHWSAYQNDLAGIVALTTGALSTPVGIPVGLGTAALALRRYQMRLAVLLDALAPGLALMLAFVSLADLSSGSSYGTISDLPWAIELWGAHRHPTQVYELLAALTCLGLLQWARPRSPYDGFLFALFVFVYGAARLFLEAYRADPWLLPGGYRTVQVIGFGMVAVSLWSMSQRLSQTSPMSNGLPQS